RAMRTAPSKEFGRRERQIMDVVYRLGRATVGDVMGRLPDPPTYSAVRAMLRYLERKGHLRHTRDGVRYVYEPTVPHAEAQRSAMQHLVRTFFRGSRVGAVAALWRPPLYVTVPATWEPPGQPPFVLGLWALGALVWAARLAPGLVALRRIARAGERWSDPAALAALAAAARLAGVTRPVRLL